MWKWQPATAAEEAPEDLDSNAEILDARQPLSTNNETVIIFELPQHGNTSQFFFHSFFLGAKELTHLCSSTLPQKRGHEREFEDSRKVSRLENWKKCKGLVDLPSVLAEILDSSCTQFEPESRDKFKKQIDNIHIGQQITLPSIGQTPKRYGEGYQKLSVLHRHRTDDRNVAPALK